MSDKRFEFYSDEDLIGVLDTVTGKTFNSFEIVDKLNEQQATINEYKENWDDMVKLATKTSLRNVELDEQIGQLRKELNDCEKFRYTVFKRMGELNDE